MPEGKITYVCAGCKGAFQLSNELNSHMETCEDLKKWLETPVVDRSI